MPDLARKLGVKTGQRVSLLNAPPLAAALLQRECPAGVEFADHPGDEPYHLILFWPTQREGLVEEFTRLQRHILPDGAIWAVIPKKRYAKARGVALTWEEMQLAGLQTDLVDNKDASFTEEEYATRFVIRKDRRAAYI